VGLQCRQRAAGDVKRAGAVSIFKGEDAQRKFIKRELVAGARNRFGRLCDIEGLPPMKMALLHDSIA
jgi:hypothetical protein